MSHVEFLENNFGWTYNNSKVLVHFGNRNLTRQTLESQFDNIKDFIFVHQVHGNSVLNIDSEPYEKSLADATLTSKHLTALCIKTADCAPVMIFDSALNKVAAIHAGWRGVANKVVESTLVKMTKCFGSKASDCMFFIGPHIQLESFEVERDVRDQILETLPGHPNKSVFFETLANQKYLVDLNKVLCEQIKALGGNDIVIINVDTLTNQNLHSFRRDKQNSGRLISFIALL